MRLLNSEIRLLADRYQAIAEFKYGTVKQRVDAESKERDIRRAMETLDYPLTFLNDGYCMVQFGKGKERWYWTFIDEEVTSELEPEIGKALDAELGIRELTR